MANGAAQTTTLSRATSFNRTYVDVFFANLRKVMEWDWFEPQDIYNVDKTDVITVQLLTEWWSDVVLARLDR